MVDGAGGSDDGLLASITANKAIRESVLAGKTLEEAYSEAHRRMRGLNAPQKVRTNPDEVSGCFAAAVTALISAKQEGIYNIDLIASGDSKILTIRNGSKLDEGTTKFQNIAQEMIDTSSDPSAVAHTYYTSKFLNVMTGSLGSNATNSKKPEEHSFEGLSGDTLIAASDGVWDNVSEYEILQIAEKNKGDAKKIEEEIYKLAYERNNSTDRFGIQHDEFTSVKKILKSETGKLPGDNITVAVTVLK